VGRGWPRGPRGQGERAHVPRVLQATVPLQNKTGALTLAFSNDGARGRGR
jgi:hypothetical protein